mgnify:CR=1 FL=1
MNPLWPDLSVRADEPELMDDPTSSEEHLRRTLAQFAAINRYLTPCHRLLARCVLSTLRDEPGRTWTLLDVGAGGGDVARWMDRQAARRGLRLRTTCLDHDPRVAAFARERSQHLQDVEVLQADVEVLADAERQWDFVFANHFLHHLPAERFVGTIQTMFKVTRRRLLISDIHRSHANYLGYTLLAALLLPRSFAFYDGRLSIRKGFTMAECQSLLDEALPGQTCRVRRMAPGHLVLMADR